MQKRIIKLRALIAVVLAGITVLSAGGNVSYAAEIPGLGNNRFVTLSPDGQAFTIGYGDKTSQGYSYDELGRIIGLREVTGIPVPGEGEHLYTGVVSGAVPVGYWELGWTRGRCIHSIGMNYRINLLNLMGANTDNCHRNYNAGWIPHCAVCGGEIAHVYFYMTEEMARETRFLPSGVPSANYFFLCPFDNSLENYCQISHVCTRLSTNKINVEYYSGADDAVGNMDTEVFYYEPGEKYEGMTVNASDRLEKCAFEREGYTFLGWSLQESGTVMLCDEAEWMTVREVTQAGMLADNSCIKLYAVWEADDEGSNGDPGTPICRVSLELEAQIERILAPSDGETAFLRGESGILEIHVSGNPDSVSVEFPEGFEQYNQVFDYSGTERNEEDGVSPENGERYENIIFMVPLNGIDDDVEILTVNVTAYRGDESIARYPLMILKTDGNVLSSLRTSLR